MPSTRITVRGPDILRPPLLDTENAAAIEFRTDGELTALFIKVFAAGNLWGFSTKQDEDWEETKIRYGYR